MKRRALIVGSAACVAAAAVVVAPAIAAKRPPPAAPMSADMRTFLAWLDTQPPTVRQYWATHSAIQARLAYDFANLGEDGATQRFVAMRTALEARHPREHAAIGAYFAQVRP